MPVPSSLSNRPHTHRDIADEQGGLHQATNCQSSIRYTLFDAAMRERVGFTSYKSTKTVAAETVYQFLHGILYGAAWGLVTPFPTPGTSAAATEKATGVFRPVPPFSGLSAVPSNAIFFGSILAVQRFAAKSLELIRRTEDSYNDLFGFVMIYPYYTTILNHSEQRLVRHNRLVGGAVLLATVYANLLE